MTKTPLQLVPSKRGADAAAPSSRSARPRHSESPSAFDRGQNDPPAPFLRDGTPQSSKDARTVPFVTPLAGFSAASGSVAGAFVGSGGRGCTRQDLANSFMAVTPMDPARGQNSALLPVKVGVKQTDRLGAFESARVDPTRLTGFVDSGAGLVAARKCPATLPGVDSANSSAEPSSKSVVKLRDDFGIFQDACEDCAAPAKSTGAVRDQGAGSVAARTAESLATTPATGSACMPAKAGRCRTQLKAASATTLNASEGIINKETAATVGRPRAGSLKNFIGPVLRVGSVVELEHVIFLGSVMMLFTGESSQFITAMFIISVLGIYHKIKPLKVPSSLPGPKRYPIIGYLWHPLKYWHVWPTETTRLARHYKQTWGGPLPNFGGLPGAYFYIHQEHNIRHILNDNFSNYGKGTMWTNVLGELLGEGIFAVDGDQWRTHRKLISHQFSRNLLRHAASVSTHKLFQVLRKFDEKISCSADESFSVDLQDVFFRLTIDSISQVTFDMDLDSVGNERQHEFARAFDELQDLCQKRFLDPLFEIKRLLRLTRRERQIRRLKSIVDAFAYKVIEGKRLSADKESRRGPDLLSRFINHARATGQAVSDRELRDVVMNILLAGRDTTACALSWTFYELTRHPEVVRKIVEEVESICGIGDAAEFSYDSMSRLKYAHCVALEVLRLHPSVPNDPRYAVKGDTLPDGTRVPPGAGFDLCFYAMGRSEEIWGRDVLEFRPERFLDRKEPSTFAYPVFNAGPRLCLGKPLALMNMKLAMSILLTSKFKLTDEMRHTGEYKWTLVKAMKDGFKVNISLKREEGDTCQLRRNLAC